MTRLEEVEWMEGDIRDYLQRNRQEKQEGV
jgi:hypothetical protein